MTAAAQNATLTLAEARTALARKSRARNSKLIGQQWERTVVARAKALGWLVHHVGEARTAKGWRTPLRGHKGFPDLVLAHPLSPQVIVAELKASDEATLSAAQRAWTEAMARAGIEVHVWRPSSWLAICARLDHPRLFRRIGSHNPR